MKRSSIRYPIAIEPGTDRTAWGVAVPDLPGCSSAGDTLDNAIDNAHIAVEAWIDAVIEDGGVIPRPHPMEEHYSDPEFAGWTWGIVEIDPMRLDTSVERVNVTPASRARPARRHRERKWREPIRRDRAVGAASRFVTGYRIRCGPASIAAGKPQAAGGGDYRDPMPNCFHRCPARRRQSIHRDGRFRESSESRETARTGYRQYYGL